MSKKHLHLTKGVHLVFPFDKLPIKQSVYFDVEDGRMIFAIPRGRSTYVGTTDTNYSGNLERVVATEDDADYLLNAVNHTFPGLNLTVDDIESNWAGLRPLIHEEDKDPSELSRKDEIFVSSSGLISIAGGKLTGYRKMAQRVIDTVLKTVTDDKKDSLRDSITEELPLVEPAMTSDEEVAAYQKELEIELKKLHITDAYYAWYLCTTYGKKASTILEKAASFTSTNVLENLIRAELWYCIHFEMTNSLTDFFVRRTGRLYFNISSISIFLDCIVDDFVSYLNWDTIRVVLEREKMQLLLKDAETYYAEEFK